MITVNKIDESHFKFSNYKNSSTLTLTGDSPAKEEIAIIEGVWLAKSLQDPELHLENFTANIEHKINLATTIASHDHKLAYLKRDDPALYPVPSVTVGKTEKSLSTFFDITPPAPKTVTPTEICINFSFGKESMLMYYMLKELGYSPLLKTIIFPARLYAAYADRGKIFETPVERTYMKRSMWVDFTTSEERSAIPHYGKEYFFVYFLMSIRPNIKTILIGTEQNCNDTMQYHGTTLYTHYDESFFSRDILSSYTKEHYNTEMASILYPVEEAATGYILWNRYGDQNIEKLQTSCHRATYKTQHCGTCEECGHIYSMLHNIHPLIDSMYPNNPFDNLSAYPFLLPDFSPDEHTYWGSYNLAILHLYNAYKNGATGVVIDKFVELGYPEKVEPTFSSEFKKVYSIYSQWEHTIPEELREGVLKIFNEELSNARP